MPTTTTRSCLEKFVRLNAGLSENRSQCSFRYIAGVIGNCCPGPGHRVPPDLMAPSCSAIEHKPAFSQPLGNVLVREPSQPPHSGRHGNIEVYGAAHPAQSFGNGIIVFSIRFQQPPRNILGDLDCFLNGSALGDQTRKFLGGSQVAAVLDLLNVKPNGELIRHSRTHHTASETSDSMESRCTSMCSVLGSSREVFTWQSIEPVHPQFPSGNRVCSTAQRERSSFCRAWWRARRRGRLLRRPPRRRSAGAGRAGRAARRPPCSGSTPPASAPRPGHIASRGAISMYCRPSRLSIVPRLGTSGGSPNPRKLKDASAMIAHPIVIK